MRAPGCEDDVVKMKEPLAKDERRKDQSVLEPLVGPRELDQRVPLGPLDSRYRAVPGQIYHQTSIGEPQPKTMHLEWFENGRA